jgi:hypothetical protein
VIVGRDRVVAFRSRAFWIYLRFLLGGPADRVRRDATTESSSTHAGNTTRRCRSAVPAVFLAKNALLPVASRRAL